SRAATARARPRLEADQRAARQRGERRRQANRARLAGREIAERQGEHLARVTVAGATDDPFARGGRREAERTHQLVREGRDAVGDREREIDVEERDRAAVGRRQLELERLPGPRRLAPGREGDP